METHKAPSDDIAHHNGSRVKEMNNTKICTQNLIKSIIESDEYQEFCEIRDKVKAEPELRRQINEFRRHVFEVQNSQEPLDLYSEQERLRRDYEDFRRQPLVSGFLAAEVRVCRMVQKITEEIAGALDLDTDDITERIEL